jgi:hypothetical protein
MLTYIFAILLCIASIVGIYVQTRSEGKKAFRTVGWWCGVVTCLCSLLLFWAADREQQKESAQKALIQERQASELERMRYIQEEQRSRADLIIKTQQEQISQAKQLEQSQASVIELQKAQSIVSNRLIESQKREILNHNLSGIEISFKPSAAQWAEIVEAYQNTKSPQPGVSYSVATMTAERDGKHWAINFKPNTLQGGPMMFPGFSTSPSDTQDGESNEVLRNKKAFEEVISKASIGLLIEWGNGTQTMIEPWRREINALPSAIEVSEDRIALILRPPEMTWNLNELNEHPTITLRGRGYPIKLPITFRIRSLDPGVVLDQTINLAWKDRSNTSTTPLLERLMNKTSGPHRLQVAFKFVPPTPVKVTSVVQ